MNQIALTGLVKIVLPSRTLRYCDGAFFVYNSETYRPDDDVFGTIGQFEPVTEGVGDLVPAITMTLMIPDATAAADVTAPGNQTARAIFIIAEYDVETGAILSAQTQFDGQLDQTIYTVGLAKKELTASVVSLAERLFEGNIGNTLNPTFHKSVWPGERGHDNATGLAISVAWGVEAPGRSGRSSSNFSGIVTEIVRAAAR